MDHFQIWVWQPPIYTWLIRTFASSTGPLSITTGSCMSACITGMIIWTESVIPYFSWSTDITLSSQSVSRGTVFECHRSYSMGSPQSPSGGRCFHPVEDSIRPGGKDTKRCGKKKTTIRRCLVDEQQRIPSSWFSCDGAEATSKSDGEMLPVVWEAGLRLYPAQQSPQACLDMGFPGGRQPSLGDASQMSKF